MGAKFTVERLQEIVKEALGHERAELRKELMAKNESKGAADLVKAAMEATQSQTELAQRMRRPREERLKLIQERSNFGAFVLAFAGAKKAGKGLEDAAKRAEKWGFSEVAKGLSEGSIADGGALVPEEFSNEFIELLRPETVLRRAGTRNVPMEREVMNMGRQTSGATFEWVGETENVTPSSQGTDLLKLSLKKGRVLTPVSNDLLRDSARPAEAFVRDDIIAAAAEGVDLAGIRGQGGDASPKGIRYITDTDHVNARTSTPDVTKKVNDLIQAIQQVDESDVPLRRPGWIMSPRTFWHLFGLLDSNNNFIFRPELAEGMLFGYPVYKTSQIPTNLGSGGDETEVYFVEFSQCMFGEGMSAEVDIFPGGAYDDSGTIRSGISRDETVIALTTRLDFAMRHPEAASVITTVDWGA